MGLHATLRADLVGRVGARVVAEGRTLPDVLDELLTAWLERKPPAKASAPRARGRKGGT